PKAVIARGALAAWKDDLTIVYLGAVLTAFLAGRLHVLVQRLKSDELGIELGHSQTKDGTCRD
ncbi:MAG: hypothetical protein WB005_13265, partial [Pseudolabrys sp.]